ncbi:mannan-binding lectin [Xanthobacter agilis]|uniref:Mannan-binding protein domain-containing protein n=1 Tax=Xanthobacter agilis TaxID=47492 RepID=A0ABU0LBS1_XANAG|nr:mannan-binding lectin [Xanthobacter agilis]MDQ0504551.1 hypothetical protein [Xanthobacter agilis]
MIARVVRLLVLAALLVWSPGVRADWVSAGPIWNNADAEGKCQRACGANIWDGNWKTVVPGQEAMCRCQPAAMRGESHGRAVEIEAGPIWNDADAAGKCARVCGGMNWWNGQWRTTISGRQSVCGCVWDRSQNPRGGTIIPVDAGVIWNEAEAETICPRICGGSDRWDGNWRTLSPGRSTCDCRMGR